MANELKPYINIGPGEFIKDEIEFNELNQQDLANIIGISYQHLSDVVNDKKPISFDIASKLSCVFKQSPQYWLNLSNNYQLRLKENIKEKELIAQRKYLFDKLPVSELVKKGFLPKPKEHDIFFREGKNIISSMEINESNSRFGIAYRKSEDYDKYDRNKALVWYSIGRKISEKINLNNYSKSGLQQVVKNIKNYTLIDDGIAKFVNDINAVGVKFFVLTHLDKTYIDGASFYDQCNPVIIYSMRYNRIDNFWFTMAHELGHILLHFNNKNELYLDDIDAKNNNEKEIEANEFAANILGTKEVVEYFDKFYKVHDKEIKKSVEIFGLHISIIIGALKHVGLISYRRMNKKEFRVNDLIPETNKINNFYADIFMKDM